MLEKLRKYGGSIYLRVQRDWLRENSLTNGSDVIVREDMNGNLIVLKPEAKQ